MHADFDVRFGHAGAVCCFGDTQTVEFHQLNGVPHFIGQCVQKPLEIVCTFDSDVVILGKEIVRTLNWDIQTGGAGLAQMVDKFLTRDGLHPRH